MIFKRFLLVFLCSFLMMSTSSFLHAQEKLPLPEGCGNPFVPPGVFGDFYEKVIQSSLIEKGSVSKAHIQLFAVNSLRKYMAEKFPNPTDGDAVDRHIRAQICSYAQGKKDVSTSSVDLHQHLLSISEKLFMDTKKIASDALALEVERQKLVAKFESRQGLIEHAERMGQQEVSSLFTKN
jgi:hypothetical protein